MNPERFARLCAVLDRRQPDLTVVMDGIHKPHNLTAVMRSCDAVGIQDVQAVRPRGRVARRQPLPGGPGRRWLSLHAHETTASALAHCRQAGMQIVVAQLAESACDFREVDYCQPTAVVLGAELFGVSDTALDAADRPVIVPMVGMVESLNVSVAGALILFEAARQRRLAGLYDTRRLPEARYHRLLFEWSWPQVADWCQRHDRPYPALTEAGELAESL